MHADADRQARAPQDERAPAPSVRDAAPGAARLRADGWVPGAAARRPDPVDQEGRLRDGLGRGGVDRGEGHEGSHDGPLPPPVPDVRVRHEPWLRNERPSGRDPFVRTLADPPLLVQGSADRLLRQRRMVERRGRREGGRRVNEDDDIERFEEERELELYREYRDVVPMFTYVVETERRFYLANSVELIPKESGWLEVALTDAWVWDMFRTGRF